MAGLTPIFTAADIDSFIDKFAERAEEKLIKTMIYAGETAVRTARISGRYNDITGNLRSSIGYAVLKDGFVYKDDYQRAGQGSDGSKGVNESKRLITELASEYNTGLSLVVVAGMDYAVFVENIDSKDVLSGAIIGTENFIRQTLDKIING